MQHVEFALQQQTQEAEGKDVDQIMINFLILCFLAYHAINSSKIAFKDCQSDWKLAERQFKQRKISSGTAQ